MSVEDSSMELKVPANMEYALVVRMALSGFGMLAELDVDLIDDLRTVTDECFDCLLHQGLRAKEIRVAARRGEGRLWCEFQAVPAEEKLPFDPNQDYEVTRCVLETLLPSVHLNRDENGVRGIDFSMRI